MNMPASSPRPALVPLISWPTRVATGLGALALMAAVCVWAAQASDEAVRSSMAAMSGGVICVTLPTVHVVGKREPAAPAAAAPATASTTLATGVRGQRTL